MTDEMFMKILELVGQAGEGGYALALAYLIYEYFSSLLVAGTILGAIWLVTRTMKSMVHEGSILKEVARLVDQSYRGEPTYSEGRQIVEAVRQATNENENRIEEVRSIVKQLDVDLEKDVARQGLGNESSELMRRLFDWANSAPGGDGSD